MKALSITGIRVKFYLYILDSIEILNCFIYVTKK